MIVDMLVLVKAGAVAPYRLFQPEVEGIGDEGMPDRYLRKARDRGGEEGEVLEAEVMPSVELQPEAKGMLCRLDEGSDRPLSVFGIEGGIGLGIELDTVRADSCCFFEVPEIRTDEDRGTYAPLLQLREDLGEEGAVCSDIPACTTRQSIGRVGDQGHLMRAYTPDELHEGGNGIPLDIEFCREDLLQVVDILVAYVALIWSGMYRDPLCSEALTVEGYLDKVGDIPSTSIA